MSVGLNLCCVTQGLRQVTSGENLYCMSVGLSLCCVTQGLRPITSGENLKVSYIINNGHILNNIRQLVIIKTSDTR
jgi:hypothetical protein